MTPTPIIRTIPDTGKNAVEMATPFGRAWLGSVVCIVISRKSEYRRSGTNAIGDFNNKYLLTYASRRSRNDGPKKIGTFMNQS